MKRAKKIDALRKLRAFVKSGNFIYRWDGLCGAIRYGLYDETTKGQRIYLISLIPREKPYEGYCWKPGAKAPRIKFINEHLKRLEKK